MLHSLRRRLAFAGCGAAFAWCGIVEAGRAGYDQFMSYGQGLSAGNAFASAGSHYGVDLITRYANHSFCPAVASGYSGYTSSPNGGARFTAQRPTCGPHFQDWMPAGTASISFHGAVWNRNQSTFDVFDWADYHW
jgi:hypothetical protein